jgi:predicted small lipoprotein YifL
VKKIIVILAVLAALLAVTGCASKPATPPPAPEVKVPPYEVLQHKGTTLGVTMPPPWIEASLQGPKTVEKLPDFTGKFVVVVDVTGKDLEGTSLAAQRLNADTEIARYLSLRVKDTFAGAQVGDKDKIETYMERCVKSVSEIKFSGFQKAADWWVQIRWYKPDGKKTWDRDEFRVLQLYTVDKTILQTQLDKILTGEEANEPKTPEKQRAMDMVQQSFFDGF